jgi:hypothetical protein
MSDSHQPERGLSVESVDLGGESAIVEVGLLISLSPAAH